MSLLPSEIPTGLVKGLPLPQRFWAKVDKSGECWLWTASAGSHGYGQFNLDGKPKLVHRLVFEIAHSVIPIGMVVDHVCHKKRCVNPSHLRLASKSQNGQNRKGLDANNTSGARGVFWNPQVDKWEARVQFQGKQYYAGRFDDIQECAKAAQTKRNELFTHNDNDR